MGSTAISRIIGLGNGLLALAVSAPLLAANSELSNEVKPYLADEALAERAAPLLELGDPFLETGNLHPGFRLPGGALWQPRLWVYGSARSAIQSWEDLDGHNRSEWVNRLDLFGNLQLSGTERLLFGIQPLHRGNEFSGRQFDSDASVEAYNDDIRTLFFEGDLAEIFPFLDRRDSTSNDIGFSIGRQPLFFQDGFLINDQLDAIGVSRNNLRFANAPWLSNLRISAVYAWNDIHRADNIENEQSKLYGLLAQWDTQRRTMNTDIVFVTGDEQNNDDLWVLGVDSIQRIGLFNTTFRVNASHAPRQVSAEADDGVLLFGELSWTPAHTDNIAYINAFVGIDQYRSAARDPLAGGPLGRTGILFAARALGAYPAALGGGADKALGLAAGYQMFFNNNRQQLVIETGFRGSEVVNENDSVGLALRYQHALGRRFIALLDGFVMTNERSNSAYGLSVELLVKF